MSDMVIVVQEAPTGMWIADCIDTRCEDAIYSQGAHTLAYARTKATVQKAATRHRAFLRILPVHEETRRSDICSNCGESAKANAELRRLVVELEARLHQYEQQEAS